VSRFRDRIFLFLTKWIINNRVILFVCVSCRTFFFRVRLHRLCYTLTQRLFILSFACDEPLKLRCWTLHLVGLVLHPCHGLVQDVVRERLVRRSSAAVVTAGVGSAATDRMGFCRICCCRLSNCNRSHWCLSCRCSRRTQWN
jgi:hypothetical protein